MGGLLSPTEALAGRNVRCFRREEGFGMKVRTSVRSLKNKQGAQVVRRHGAVFVINKRDPRFKARQG